MSEVQRYRKPPVEVEAVQWTGSNIEEVMELVPPEDLPQAPDDPHIQPGYGHSADGMLSIPNPTGTMEVEPGDWIVVDRSMGPHPVPLKPEVFQATYQPVEEGEGTFCERCNGSFGEVGCQYCNPQGLREAARAALADFDDTGDYEAPVQALRDLLGQPSSVALAPLTDEDRTELVEALRELAEDEITGGMTLTRDGLLVPINSILAKAADALSQPEPVEEGGGEGGTRHELKCWPPYFGHVADGRKTFECRSIEDRTFAVGDTLLLREFDNRVEGGYTGRSCERRVTFVLGDGAYGIEPGHVVLGLALTQPQPSNEEGEATRNPFTEEGFAPDMEMPPRRQPKGPNVLSTEEATAVVAAAFSEDHHVPTVDAVVKRLADWVDASVGATPESEEDRG